ACAAGACEIALNGERDPHAGSDSWHMEFLMDDIESVADGLAHRGVSVSPIREEPVGRIATFQDPEGNVIGLEEPPKRTRGKVVSGRTRSVRHGMTIEEQIKADEDEIQETPYNKAKQQHRRRHNAENAKQRHDQAQ